MAEGSEICRAFRNTGHCRYGEECKFIHEEGPPIAPPNKPVGMVRDPLRAACVSPPPRVPRALLEVVERAAGTRGGLAHGRVRACGSPDS
eukprot:COSAG03_NODE_6848_length_996_cov_2.069119_1_plen_90_part_00